jgi:hypothetical protein
MEQPLVAKVLSLIYNEPVSYSEYGDYESLVILSGQPKPPKEEFEAKLQELIDAQPLKDLRKERDRRLAEVDWVVIRATSTDTPVPEEWKTYMQALRDLPSNTEDPANPVWPSIPTS